MKIPRMQWVVAALLFLATMLNYADRVALSVVSVEFRGEFGLNEQDYSHIVVMFMVAYAIMYAGSGYVIDRLGTRRGFGVFIFGWSIAQMLHGIAIGKWTMGGARFALGLFEPGNWPAAAKAVSEWFPANRRALGIGIFNAGSSLGAAIAPPLVALLAGAYGWRGAFFVTGAMGFAWLVLWFLFYQPPHRNRFITAREYDALKDHVRPPGETEAAKDGVDWRRVIRHRGCWTLIAARFFTDPVIYFILFWLPEYLRKERGFDLAQVGQYAWVPHIFGDIGYISGGWISSKLMDRGWPIARARKAVLILGACCMPFGILAPRVPTPELAIAATCLMTLGHALWISNLLTIPTDLFAGREVATASGFTGMGGAIGGILATLGTGWLVTNFSYTPVFLIAGLMHPLALCIVLLVLRDRYFPR